MLCPICSVEFDKDTNKDLEKVRPQQQRKLGQDNRKTQFVFDKRGLYLKTFQIGIMFHLPMQMLVSGFDLQDRLTMIKSN